MKLQKLLFLYIFCACSIASVLTLAITALFVEITVVLALVIAGFLVLISLLTAFFISKKITSRIAKPINEIDLSQTKNPPVFDEFEPFWDNLNLHSKKISNEMKKIKREHKRQDKVRKEFTANVTHELKTPLTSISGYAEIMKNGMVKPEDVSRFSDKIYDEAQRMIMLVGDIIKLSRLDENAVEVKKERIELYSLCETIIGRLESAAAKNNIAFELSGQPAEINGISRIIDEMIYNLCDNAIKYNKENGKVTVSIKQTATDVILSVADTGIGIDKEDQKRVFERFYRVNKSHSREIGGTGLGLSIVKHGAAVHNAKLKIESELNKGTTISIIFQ